MKKIAVVTGTRAEYGALKPAIDKIRNSKELRLLLVVTGMHLSREFGGTVDVIEQDGFSIDARVEMMPDNDTLIAMAASVGKGIIGMVEAFDALKPDVVLVIGDRTEALAAAVSAAYLNIPVAHIHGGDACSGGNIDDANRFAITKFAHIHFPATEKSAERIKKLGEEEWRIHQVGSPALDAILNEPLPEADEIAAELGLNLAKKLILVVQHPVTVQMDDAGAQMKETLEAVVESEYPAIVIYPNSDAGGRKMIEVIRGYEHHPQIKTYRNLPRRDYLGLLSVAGVMVGNSSSGLIDAPSFGLPVVNIGIRQEGRERGNNIIDTDHRKSDIVNAIDRALNDTALRTRIKKSGNPYGDGKASERIIKVLEELELSPELIRKKITY